MRWRFLLLHVACTADTDTGEELCEDQPVLTYENFGEGFMTLNCQTCHSSERTGDDRHDAPETIHFDNKQEVAIQASIILGVATGPNAIMPPGGGLSDEDREKLEIWLR